MNLEALIENAVKSHVVDPDRHGMLIRAPERIAQRANIPVRALFTSAVGVVTNEEYDWFKSYYSHPMDGTAGLIVCAVRTKTPITDRFAAIAGWAIRNGLSARVLYLPALAEAMEAGEVPDPDLLLIPDFLVGKGLVSSIVATRMAGFLHARHSAGKQTVLYSSLGLSDVSRVIRDRYGPLVASHVEAHFSKGTE